MATFEAQVEGLTSLSIDGSSAPTQTELTQFLSDGAIEIINFMPPALKQFCATEDTFTSTAVGSEAETLDSAQVLSVTRNDGTIDQPCRLIPPSLRGRVSDSDDMNAATTTDPVYYIYNGKINALPASGSCKYLEVNNPTVAYSDSAISNFPDEYEYLVPLYASIKSLQNVLGDRSSNADITTALTAINTELDETLSIADNVHTEIALINSSTDSAIAEILLANAEADEIATQTDGSSDFATALTAINTELDKVDEICNEANIEFDKVPAQITEASVEFDESKNLLGSHSGGGMTVALTALNTELDETQAICDSINTNVDNAVTQISEAATQVDASVDTALAAMATAAGRINSAVTLASAEFDKSDALLDLGETDSEGDINTALTALKAAVDQAEAAANKFENADSDSVFGDESTFLTNDSQLARVKTALDEAQDLINANEPSSTTDAYGAQANEDIELVSSALNIAQTEISRAQMHLQEWTAIGDMRVKEVNVALAEADGYAKEIQSRLAQSRAKIDESQARINSGNAYLGEANAAAQEVSSYASEVNARIAQVGGYNTVISANLNAAQGYANEIQTKINIASAYANEVSAYSTASGTFIGGGNAYLQEAQSTIASGDSYLREAQQRISQAQGYVAEVNARSNFTGAKSQAVQSYIATANAYLQSAQGYVASAQSYSNEIQSKLGIAQGYSNEAQTRLAVDSSQYSWYEKQQAKLQGDYDKGIQIMRQA